MRSLRSQSSHFKLNDRQEAKRLTHAAKLTGQLNLRMEQHTENNDKELKND